MPSTATKVQHALGITRGAAFDVNAACSGFVYAMTIANSFYLVCLGKPNAVLVIGAETYSRILDWKDRGTCILFGDGAAASGSGRAGATWQCFRSRYIVQRHSFRWAIHPITLATNGGVSSTMTSGRKCLWSAKKIFRHAVNKDASSGGRGVASAPVTNIGHR